MNRTQWNVAAARMPVWGAHFFESATKARMLWNAIERIHGKGSGMIRKPRKLSWPNIDHWRVARRPVHDSKLPNCGNR